jgi:squalene cyclase
LNALSEWQAADGSIAASPLWTAVVVMNLAGSGHAQHAIVSRGVEYLLSTIRADASWAIVADLSMRNTALAMHSLADDPPDLRIGDEPGREHDLISSQAIDWLLAGQHAVDSSSGIAAGGWSWTDAPAALPNVSDTAATLVALTQSQAPASAALWKRLDVAVERGLNWLLDQQHDDGGWSQNSAEPTSAATSAQLADVTSGALYAIAVWKQFRKQRLLPSRSAEPSELEGRVRSAIARGLAWLASKQRGDGSFAASSFGNEHHPDQQSPVYGTSRVLAACAALGRLDSEMARRGAFWLARAQHAGGGWGPPRTPLDYSGTYGDGTISWRANETLAKFCSVEETAWAVAALLPLIHSNLDGAAAVANGLAWLAEAVENDLHRRPAVVGVWPGNFWYDDRLYPLIFAADALSRAVRQLTPQRPIPTAFV